YFQQCGGFECRPVSAELTYGLERICMYLQDKANVFDIEWTKGVRYGEVFHANEVEMSTYAFQASDPEMLFRLFDSYEKECKRLIELELPLPAYDYALKCSHAFNLLDARGAISVTERASFIKRVRDNARRCAEGYLRQRERLGYPLLKTRWTVGDQPPVLEGKPASDFWKTVSFANREGENSRAE
ncbi:MAG TPA: glycine--tRNA ligase subunit alpha, partial [Myxococcaceae bacterium]|nr:glycine--tRNA ligase subunit alpha [Myxococcaceae bacterium]